MAEEHEAMGSRCHASKTRAVPSRLAVAIEVPSGLQATSRIAC